MIYRDAFDIAIRSMRATPLRTGLTALGIIVGIAAVISLLGLGNGLRDGFSYAFGNLSKVIVISKTTPVASKVAQVESLRERDVAALESSKRAPDVESVTPLRNGTAVIHNGQLDYVATVNGTTPTFLAVRNDSISAGRMFTSQEVNDKARVIVLGSKVVKYLFNDDPNSALGADVLVGRLTFRVVGTLAPAGDDQDHFAPMPITTSRALFGGLDTLNGIGVVAKSADRVPAAMEQIYQIMDRQHRVEGGQYYRDYVLAAALDQISKFERYLTLLNVLTLIIGGICLLVGTIGVGNIMMVTVSHRTAEIGILKAIGARKSAIMKQFLIEAMALTGLGGLIGIALGLGAVFAASAKLTDAIPGLGRPWVSGWSIAAVFGISLLIGLIAGTYPAHRASRLNPIEALRG